MSSNYQLWIKFKLKFYYCVACIVTSTDCEVKQDEGLGTVIRN